MRWTIGMLAAGALLAPLGAAAQPAAAGTATRACGQIGFTPGSDDVAARIRATGLTCGLARDFVRDSEGRPGARFRGLRCASTPVEAAELPYRRYRCTGAGDVITWRRY
jgi:hypothetical protein